MSIFTWFVLIFSVALIGFVAIQQSKDDISQAFSGEKSDLFKNQKMRGFEFFLQMATLVCALGFVTFVILAGTL